MKKILILCIIALFLSATQTQAYTVKTFTPLKPIEKKPQFQEIQPFDIEDYQVKAGENYPKITDLEYNFFNKSFENESIYSRLTRLENKVFRQSYAGMPLSNRVDNLMSNIDEGIFYGIKNKDLLKLEQKILGRTYERDDTDSRITRLEKEMLGAMQSGNLKERYETVKTASKHYNSYPEIVQNHGYYTTPQYTYPTAYPQNTNRGLVQNLIGKLFGDMPYGALTGYTPPIYDQYNQYSPYYYSTPTPNTGFREYNAGNSGSYYRNRGYGGGAGVKILN